MTCDAVLDLVEPIAAGDLSPDLQARAHLETCPRCAAALATAHRIESYLATRPAPEAPPRFEAAVQQRIRRERWQTEQHVDRLFNVAIAAAALLLVAGGALMLNIDAVFGSVTLFGDVVRAAGADMVVATTPWLGTYVTATALLLSALGMWWWAESS